MADLFAGGHLRFINGEWRDDNGDPFEIAEVVHGRWEDVFKGNCAWARYKCSVCGGYALYRHEQDIIGKWETVQALTAYCPYCGAYMEKGEVNGNL